MQLGFNEAEILSLVQYWFKLTMIFVQSGRLGSWTIWQDMKFGLDQKFELKKNWIYCQIWVVGLKKVATNLVYVHGMDEI